MKIRVLFDTDACDRSLRTGWGVAFLINKRILFDTGEKGPWLLHNMGKLRVDMDTIKAVVISHDHWDHEGGLMTLLKRRPAIRVYGCHGFSREFRDAVRKTGACLVETAGVTEIAKNIFLSGCIPFTYKNERMVEQALILTTRKGITVLTGCAHPGITAFIRKAKKNFPGKKILLAAGGFHLMKSGIADIKKTVAEVRKLKVKKVGPTHCSGKEAQRIFRDEYKKDYVTIVAGKIFSV